jgi:tetratricopeptide (TPR) repeat protein
MAIHLRDYALLLMEVGRLAEAGSALDEALVAVQGLDDDRGLAWVEQALAELDVRLGEWPSARQRLDRSLRVQQRLGDREGEAQVLRSLGNLAMAMAEHPDAVDMYHRSLRWWRELGTKLEQARTLARLERALEVTAGAASARDARDEWRRLLGEMGLDEACLRLPPRLPASRGGRSYRS